MFPQKMTKFPPLRSQETYRLQWTEGCSIYSGTQRKPRFLLYLENNLDKELRVLNPNEPNFQKIKLQAYRGAFCAFIKEFKTYQPFLSAIKTEYENTLAYQDDQLQEMERLRFHSDRMTEENNKKIQVCKEKEQMKIKILKEDNEKLKNIIQTVTSNEKYTETIVNHLQSELSSLYLQYRDECDARKLLIYQLNELKDHTSCFVKNEQSEKKSKESADLVELQLSLKICRKDLTETQEELTRIKAEYWDVVPRRDWEALEKSHKQTLHQLKTLQSDFDTIKTEFGTLLEMYKKGNLKKEEQCGIEKEKDVSHVEKENNTQQIQSVMSETDMLLAHQIGSEQMNTPDASALGNFDNTHDSLSSHKLYDLPEEPDVTSGRETKIKDSEF